MKQAYVYQKLILEQTVPRVCYESVPEYSK